MSTVSSSTAIPAGTWSVDPVHSRVGFAVKRMGIVTVRGEFTEFEGTFEVQENLARTKAHGTVKIASVDTGDAGRDEHLRSPDFFGAARYPTLSFESTGIEALDDDEFRITGQLTIHGITKAIVLHAKMQGPDIYPWGNLRVGLDVTGRLSRADYGMEFNQALASGNLLVGDKVDLVLDISAFRQA